MWRLLVLVALAGAECPEASAELALSVSGPVHIDYADKPNGQGSWRQTARELREKTVVCARGDACFKLDVSGNTGAVSVSSGQYSASCGVSDCYFRGCVAPSGDLEWLVERNLDTEVPEETLSTDSPDDASARMLKVFDQVRKLNTAYSYDFDCTSSLEECVDDSQCSSDEYCFFSSSRKKQRMLRDASGKSRSLLFGTNSVGECVCS
ncbi:hypothetical protein CTAYLR_001556 [Chrysophaeum taylorii]|uniref:Uncharacterized protein n=1 Tax=Chrysophaeum taylorii TaxID=2483200 RepID=A0AAD7XP16_9STRA|nr:hypothetical protein CTAYLR_001556 [Chrysophaeum taylorii]